MFLLTNRFNLLVMLGSRLITPRAGYRKYYSDLLELTPGFVPLLAGPPSPELVEVVTADGQWSFPVMLELTEVPSSLGTSDPGLYFCEGLPFSHVQAVHFKDERALREHEARPYANIHPHSDLHRVTPELFGEQSSAIGRGQIEAAVAGLTETPSRDWDLVDRRRGAVAAAVAATSSSSTFAISEALLSRNLRRHQTPAWLSPDALRLTPPESGLGDSGQGPAGRTADDLLFEAAYSVLGDTDVQNSWSPRTVVTQVRERVADFNPAKNVAAAVARNLDSVAAIVGGEREFQPFKRTAQGLTTAKALLLVLLREDLKSLLEWPADETHADPIERQAAAVLAGALRGVARENVAVRNVAVDDLTAAWACDVGRQPEVAEVAAEAEQRLSVAGHVVASVSTPPPTPREALTALPDVERAKAARAICERLGWSDLLVSTVRFGGAATITAEGSEITVSGKGAHIDVAVDEAAVLARIDEQPPDASLLAEVLGRS